MRKEIILVVIASVLFGAVIAFGVWRANTALRNDNDNSTSSEGSAAKVDNEESPLRLTLAKPSNDDVVTESPITISGVTSPESWVVITTEEDDYISQADQSGSFEESVDLSGGINQITTYIFDKSGNSVNETVRVVYSSEFAEAIE